MRLLFPHGRDEGHSLVVLPELLGGHRIASNGLSLLRLGRFTRRVSQRLGKHPNTLAVARSDEQRCRAEAVVRGDPTLGVERFEIPRDVHGQLFGLALGHMTARPLRNLIRSRTSFRQFHAVITTNGPTKRDMELMELHRPRVHAAARMEPHTLLVGSVDERFSKIAARMAASFGAATVERVPGAGHNLVLKRPEAVASAISRRLGAPS